MYKLVHYSIPFELTFLYAEEIAKNNRSGMSGMVTVQDQIQADWDNRELIQVITTSIMRIAHFDMSARLDILLLSSTFWFFRCET